MFQTLKIGEGADELWYRSADAWGAHMTARRDAPAVRRTPFWMQVYAANSSRDESATYNAGGFTQTIRLDYKQDYYGFQSGYEFGAGAAEGEGVVFGATGGYLSSHMAFSGTADRIRYEDVNIGVYAGYVSGGFYANALAKYDFLTADVRNVTAGYATDLDGDTYGVRFETGYRWQTSGGFFAEPVVSIEYIRTDLDDINALGATVSFDDYDGLRGQAGLRLGGETALGGGGGALTYYLGGRVVHEFEGEGRIIFTSGSSTIGVTNEPLDTYGRFEIGLNILSAAGVSGFLEANADINDDYRGFGGRAGIRIPF